MASGFKNPPCFGDCGGNSYEVWKTELEMWMLVTDIKEEKQALAVTLSLKGQARAIALESEKSKLNSKDGMQYLLSVLDPVFQKNETDISYSIFTQFENFQRSTQTMSEYIVEFERLYNLMKNKSMELPEAILAFKLLDKAGLERRDKQLALTACSNINFENMKSALKRIFGETACGSNEFEVKQEVFYNRYGHWKNEKGSFKDNSKQKDQIQKGTNPLDRQGRKTKCAICSSVFHWVKDCPHKDVKYVEEDQEDE